MPSAQARVNRREASIRAHFNQTESIALSAIVRVELIMGAP
jgi:hypothetical protein